MPRGVSPARLTSPARPTATIGRQLETGFVNPVNAGVYACKQWSGAGSLQTADVNTALQMAGVKGLSFRVQGSDMFSNHAVGDPNGIFQEAMGALANAGVGGQRIQPRVMAGTTTPAELFDVNGGTIRSHAPASPCGNGVLLAPVPFHADGSVGTELWTLFGVPVWTLMAQSMIANGQNGGLLRGFHPGDQFAEINHGATLRGLAGYSYANFLAGEQYGMQQMANIAHANGLCYEFANSGCGPISGAAGVFSVNPDFADYLVSLEGGKLGSAYCQANGWSPQPVATAPTYVSLYGTTAQDSETKNRIGFRPMIHKGVQIINPGNWPWKLLFDEIKKHYIEVVEIYTINGAGDGTNPNQGSFSGANSAALATEIASYNTWLSTLYQRGVSP